MNEFRFVVGYEGIYQVSSDGRVFSLPRKTKMPKGGHVSRPGRELKQRIVRSGYAMVALYKGGEKQDVPVHRLVCTAFNGPCGFGKSQVNHIDGIKTNNNFNNLEWVTPSENVIHTFKKLGRTGRRIEVCSFNAKTGLFVKKYGGIFLVKEDGHQPSNVTSCLKGRQKTSGGLMWRYWKDVVV